MKRWLGVLLLALAAYAATGVYFVQPHERAVVRRFGAVAGPPRPPGAHWGLPWGLDRVDRIKPGEVKRVVIGPMRVAQDPVGAAPLQFLTADRNLVNVQATVQYSVNDPARYLFQTADVDRLVASAAEAALTEILAAHSVDWALTSGKREMGVLLADQLQQATDRYALGVTVRSVDFSTVAPPADVAEAFAKVIAALREREQAVHQAESFANRTLAQARGEAQRRLDEAKAYHDRTIYDARGRAARFEELLDEYLKAPALTATRLYLETLAQVLPRFRSKLVLATDDELDLSVLRKEQP